MNPHSERDRVDEIMRDMSRGEDAGNKLVYDKRSKTLRPSSKGDSSQDTISVTPSDLEVFAGRRTRIQ